MTVRPNSNFHAFHRAHDALLRAAFAGDQARAARHRKRLDRLALALKGDEDIQWLYRQAVEITEAPNAWEHALRILESLHPGQARSVTK